MFCQECGAKLLDDAVFCTECGAPIPPENRQTNAASQYDTVPQYDAAFQYDAVPGVDATTPMSTPQVEDNFPTQNYPQTAGNIPPQKKTNKGLIAACVIVAVLALAGGGLAAWHFLGPGLSLPGMSQEEEASEKDADATQDEEASEEKKEERADDADKDEKDEKADKDDEAAREAEESSNNGASSNSGATGMAAISGVSSSSTLQGDDVTSYYGPNNLIDGDYSTGWAEGVSGTGVGEWFQVDFSSPQEVHGIAICPGYAKSQKLFAQNGCPTAIRVYFSDGTTMDATLQDSLTSGVEMQGISTETTHTTDYIRVEIVSVRPGSYYDDTVISEFSFY